MGPKSAEGVAPNLGRTGVSVPCRKHRSAIRPAHLHVVSEVAPDVLRPTQALVTGRRKLHGASRPAHQARRGSVNPALPPHLDDDDADPPSNTAATSSTVRTAAIGRKSANGTQPPIARSFSPLVVGNHAAMVQRVHAEVADGAETRPGVRFSAQWSATQRSEPEMINVWRLRHPFA